MRLIARRVKPTPGSQLALFAIYSYHGFITDRDGETLELEAGHRRHAEIENAIRDLKYGVGLNHMPSGRFAANGAWLAVQVMAHNLARWTARIGLGEQTATTKTIRRGSSPWPDGSPARHAASPCICHSAGLGNPVKSRPGTAASDSTPSLTTCLGHSMRLPVETEVRHTTSHITGNYGRHIVASHGRDWNLQYEAYRSQRPHGTY